MLFVCMLGEGVNKYYTNNPIGLMSPIGPETI